MLASSLRGAPMMLAAMVLSSVFLQACATSELDDVRVVHRNLDKDMLRGNEVLSFDTGMLADGRAVLLRNGNAAFWVHDGKAYAVNDKAREFSPGLSAAPPAITYEAVLNVAK